MVLRSERGIKEYLNELKDLQKEYEDENTIEHDEELILEIQIETLEYVLLRNAGRMWFG